VGTKLLEVIETDVCMFVIEYAIADVLKADYPGT
jgi:hypothetical protein